MLIFGGLLVTQNLLNKKKCKGERNRSGVVGGSGGRRGWEMDRSGATKKRKTVRALRRSERETRGLILSSRTESPDSKRIFTL